MTQKSNILLVVFDSLSAHDLNRHLDNLPTLQACVNQSLNFTNAYACCPESSPARASLLTGLDIAVHGLWTDGVALPKRERSLPQFFAAQGYHSWLVGRRQLAGVSHWTAEPARPQEYHHFDWAHGPLHRSRQNAYLAWLQHEAPAIYAEIFPRQADPDDPIIPAEERQAMAELQDALSFNTWVGQQVLGRLSEAPFFGVAGFVVGLSMGASAATTDTLNLRALQQADAALSTILKALPKDTIVVLTAGRGSVKDTASPDVLQEAAIKVPLMIQAPDVRQRAVQEIVSTTDIATTLYACAKLHPPQRVQGTSLITVPPRGWALSRLRHPELPHQTALISGRWKLVITHGAPDATRLYDLHVDPAEAQNLATAPQHQDDLEAMIDLMIDARVASEDRLEPRIAKF